MKKQAHNASDINHHISQRIPFHIEAVSLVPYFILVVLIVTLIFLNPSLFSLEWLGIKSNAALILVLVAMGQTIVILTGGIDLSVGGMVSLSGVLTATHMGNDNFSIILWSGIILVIGAFVGLLNGLIVVYLRIQPFIATLATWSIIGGVAIWILPTDGGNVSEHLKKTITGSVIGLPLSVVFIAMLIGLWMYLKKTPFGRSIYAIGSNEKAAYLNGSNVKRIKVTAYMICGFIGALAGMYLSVSTGTGSPTIGNSYILISIAAVVIGGTRLSGGRGDAVGSIVGGFILLFINDILLFAGISSYYTSLFQGILLIAAVTFGSLSEIIKLRRRGK